MTDDSDTVVWLVSATNNSRPIFHTDADCRHLSRAEHPVRQTTRDKAESWDREPCQTCTTIPSKPDSDAEVVCPHCGGTFQSLGLHIPCDDGDAPDDDCVRGGASL